jgi:hypothetical protein
MDVKELEVDIRVGLHLAASPESRVWACSELSMKLAMLRCKDWQGGCVAAATSASNWQQIPAYTVPSNRLHKQRQMLHVAV